MQNSIEIIESASAPETCLNCGTVFDGDYCSECGQEAGSPIVSLGESISELLEEFIKFDTKLLNTFRYLISKPGFLTNEYAAGRRTSYLQPIKLYLTLNFFVFLLNGWLAPIELEADTLQAFFPGEEIALDVFNSTLSAAIPAMMILIIPLFALLLKIVYIRRKHLFALHFIFALHFFSFFLISAVPMLFNSDLLETILLPGAALYLLLAMRTVYGQSWIKTGLKWILTCAGAFVLLIVWLVSSFLYSYFAARILS